MCTNTIKNIVIWETKCLSMLILKEFPFAMDDHVFIYYCTVEFNQSSCWLYSMPNLLVF